MRRLKLSTRSASAVGHLALVVVEVGRLLEHVPRLIGEVPGLVGPVLCLAGPVLRPLGGGFGQVGFCLRHVRVLLSQVGSFPREVRVLPCPVLVRRTG